MDESHPRAEVLGRLLVALQTLDILPTRETMAAFLDRALAEVPGVTAVRMFPPDADTSLEAPGRDKVPHGTTYEAIPMRTPRADFGSLRLSISNPETYAAYRSFLLNLGHMLATILENRKNAAQLSQANERLSGLVDELERRVEERTRHLLEKQEQLLLSAKVFDSSAEGIIITDAEQRILSVNRSFCEITGFPSYSVLGKTPRLLSSGHHDKQFYVEMWTAIESTGQWQGEIWNRRRDGELYPEWLSISSVCNQGGAVSHYVGIFSDITQRKRAEARLDFLAYHDMLTELPNRVLLRSRFDYELLRAKREGTGLALVFLDLDEFKRVNDSLGHRAGDLLLQSVAHRLTECLRKSDTVARHGGDEFLILLPDLRDRGAIAGVVAKLLEGIAQPYAVDGHETYVSASLGIALYPDDGADLSTLMRSADRAMYQAKEAGRNTYRFFKESMNAGAFEYLAVRDKLRRALAKQEFALHYQPQIDLETGAVMGAEALLRWLSPDAEATTTAQLISVAENSGLIVPIGAWVLEQACRDAANWQRQGLPGIVVAVNLSAVQFRRGNLEKTVARALQLSGLAPTRLELEFTESLLIQDDEAVLATVRQLKSLGVSLSIDDFGTGYSSLAYLKRFQVDKLKIDQSFIRNLPNDAENLAIVGAIVQMASSLRLRIVAEGVETEAAATALQELRCREAQGYLFSKPVPEERFVQLLATAKAHSPHWTQ